MQFWIIFHCKNDNILISVETRASFVMNNNKTCAFTSHASLLTNRLLFVDS